MASTSELIASAIVTLIKSVSGSPALVEWRKTEVFYPSQKGRPPADGDTGVIVSGGQDKIIRRHFGKSADHEYAFQIAYFKGTTPRVPGDDVNPLFFKAVKTALSVTTLAGVPVVWDFELAERMEWENEPFADGIEVSRCGVLYRTNEGW